MCRPCLYTAHVYRDDVTFDLGRHYIYGVFAFRRGVLRRTSSATLEPQFWWDCSPWNPAPGGNPGLKRTRIGATFKTCGVAKTTFKLKINLKRNLLNFKSIQWNHLQAFPISWYYPFKVRKGVVKSVWDFSGVTLISAVSLTLVKFGKKIL
jgi:hypothetical protein